MKLIEDIQERLVRRHFYRSPGEAVFFSDSHGNAVDETGKHLFYRDGALWYVGAAHQSEKFKRSIFAMLLVVMLVPIVLLINRSSNSIAWAAVVFAGVISLLLFAFFRSRKEQAADMSEGRTFRRITYTEFRRKFFGYNSSVRTFSYGGFFALSFACIFTLTALLLSHGAVQYLFVFAFLAMAAFLVLALYSLAVRKAWERYRTSHGLAAEDFIRPTGEALPR